MYRKVRLTKRPPIFQGCIHNPVGGATEELCKELSVVPVRSKLCEAAQCDCPWRQVPKSTDGKVLFPRPTGRIKDRITEGAKLLSNWRAGGQQAITHSHTKSFEADCWNSPTTKTIETGTSK